MCAMMGYFVAHERLFKPLREYITLKNREAGRFFSCEKCLTFWITATLIKPCLMFPVIVSFWFPVMTAVFVAAITGVLFEKLK